MKYIIYLLLFIGSVKGQRTYPIPGDSNVFSEPIPNETWIADSIPVLAEPNGMTNKGSSFSHVEAIEFIGMDSIGVCGYQRPGSTFVVIGDSARLIKVLAESLDRTGKFRVRWPKKITDTRFRDTAIMRYSPDVFWEPDGITGHRDTVKWKPYYQKKKRKVVAMGTFNLDSGTFMPLEPSVRPTAPSVGAMYKNDSGEFMYDGYRWLPTHLNDSLRIEDMRNGKIYIGGKLKNDTPINAITSTNWVRDNYSDFEWTRPYPWWKKALWVLLGVFIVGVVIVIRELVGKKQIFEDNKHLMN